MPRRVSHGQSGQSLIQLMIVVAILGIMGTLVARLTQKVAMSWLTQRLQARMSFNAESARRFLTSNIRDASTASVKISRQAVGEPMLSKISWVDPRGNSRTVYQLGSKLHSASWSGTVTNVAKVAVVLNEGLVRFHAYYPDTKNASKIAFGLVLSKNVTANSPVPAQMNIEADVELKNP